MKCFYHSADLDGHCSGAIVKYFYPTCEMYPINYGNDFPWNVLENSETVYMVDFSLQPFDLMLYLNSICNLIWIDHHKSALEESKQYTRLDSEKNAIPGYREIGIGACKLTWEYLTSDPVPTSVEYLARYDVYNLSNPLVLPFQYGMRLYETDPSNPKAMEWWKTVFDPVRFKFDEIVTQGEACLKYQDQLNKRMCKEAFETRLNLYSNMKCIAINGRGNSKVFDSIWDPKKYDIMILFFMRSDRKWVVSLYTTHDNIDVSVIAKNYGGGGHKQAAGFVCETLPFI